MTFKTDMAADVLAVFLEEDDFAEAATFMPQESLTGFACVVTPGDIEEGFPEVGSGRANQLRAPFVGDRAALRTAIGVIEAGVPRDPRRGDRLVFASGAYLGTWMLERVANDVGGAITMFGRCETRNEVSGDIGGESGGT